MTVSKSFSGIRVGLVVRADDSGLGYQTKAIHDLLSPSKVLLIDSTPLNGREQHYDWYKNPIVSQGFITDESIIREFLKDLDVVISCEVFYNDRFTDISREMGVKTILQPNPELNPYVYQPSLTKPDAFFLPTPWYQNEISKLGKTYLCPPPITVKRTHVDISKEPGELNILHIAGRRAYQDRNGTELVRGLLNTGLNITIIEQGINGVDNPEDLYKGGYHVMLLPRRYGGLCLPVLEALAHGMPVIMPQLSPNVDLLDPRWLTQVSIHTHFNTKSRVKGGISKPRHLYSKLIEFKEMDNDTYQEHRRTAERIFNEYQDGLSNWKCYIEEVANE
jgi:hypothetical protein